MLEIERRFLVDPKVAEMVATSAETTEFIEQYYLTTPDAEGEIRIRKSKMDGDINPSYSLAVKTNTTPLDGLVRREKVLAIDRYLYDAFLLSGLIKTKPLSKRRYHIKNEDYKVELNHIFPNVDLWIAEIEFKTKEEAVNFVSFSWLGMEVTNDPKYFSRNIANSIMD